jgi:predicted transcriptional regulator
LVLPDLGEIEKKRRKLGLTQAKLANIADISRSSLAKIEEAYRTRRPTERSRYVPNYEDAKRIIESLEREESYRMAGMLGKKVSAISNSPVRSVRPEDTVGRAKKLMKEHDFSQLPVIEHGACVGRISESTILDLIGSEESLQNVYDKEVGTVMGEPFPVVSENTSIQTIIPLIKEQKAVLVSGRSSTLRGIITAFDVMG